MLSTATSRPSMSCFRTAETHLWARLPRGLDDVEVAAAARRGGVIVMPGRPFFPAEAPGPHLRLSFSAAATETELDVAVRRLAAAAPN